MKAQAPLRSSTPQIESYFMIETKASDHEMIIMPKGENVSVSLEKSPVGADDWPFFGSWQKGVGGESSGEAWEARSKGFQKGLGAQRFVGGKGPRLDKRGWDW